MTDAVPADYAVKTPVDGEPPARLPPLVHECTVNGLRMIALPPGHVVARHVLAAHLVDINFAPTPHEIDIGGDWVKPSVAPEESISWLPCGADFTLRVRNVNWNLLIELDPARAHALMVERLDGREWPDAPLGFRPDPQAALLGRLAIARLREGEPDRFLLEGLGLAVLGSALTTFEAARPIPAEADRRVARAMEHAEAHLGEDLCMAELAAVAGPSPSRFAACFKATTGQPVFAWVRERRLTRARALLAGPRLPLAEIAERAGFADQSHMTRAFRARWGATPGGMRRR